MNKHFSWTIGVVLASFAVALSAGAAPLIVKSIDKTWNRYTSIVYGFSIKVPKASWFGDAKCAYTTADNDHSYRPKGGYLPVQVFADGANRYIAQASYSELTGATIQNGVYYYSGCVKRTNSAALLKKNHELDWKMSVHTVKNEKALTALIKKEYGSSCAWKKSKSTQTGVYDVSIVGDGKDLFSTLCPVNFAVAIKYYPAKHKVAYWNLGQATSFATRDGKKIYDQDMVKSFRFQ